MLSIFVDCFSRFAISNILAVSARQFVFRGVSDIGQTGGNVILIEFGNRDGKFCDLNGLNQD